MADPLPALLALSFLPPLAYLGVLLVRHPGRSLRAGLLGFGYGASMSIVVLGFAYLLLAAALGNPIDVVDEIVPERGVDPERRRDFVLLVLLAPAAEEAAKGFGVWLLGARLASRREGVLLGAAVGLGFAAIETFTYLLGALALASGPAVLPGVPLEVGLLALARALTSALVHPAATGLTGLGLGWARATRRPLIAVALPFYAMAVALHAGYNYLAAFLPPQDILGVEVELNFLAALALAGIAWAAVERAVARPR